MEHTLWSHLPLLVRSNSKDSVEYILQALWRTRKTGLDPADRDIIRDMLQLQNESDLDPVHFSHSHSQSLVFWISNFYEFSAFYWEFVAEFHLKEFVNVWYFFGGGSFLYAFACWFADAFTITSGEMRFRSCFPVRSCLSYRDCWRFCCRSFNENGGKMYSRTRLEIWTFRFSCVCT